MLHFSGYADNFAQKTTRKMNNAETDFRILARFLENTPARPDFPAVCRLLRIRPGALDDYLVRELGLCGEELMMQI